MTPILSEIMDQLADIEEAMNDEDTDTDVNQMLDTLYDFVSYEEDKAERKAWLKATGILP
tara:strand:+ start:662 stop:841 length:180 start_codon:yes stop_codon:yes gene_type:complete